VLIVQHSLENRQRRQAKPSSVVACARVFSNCHRATEGGIPRSSRSRWFA
jgi:hypothetical protein